MSQRLPAWTFLIVLGLALASLTTSAHTQPPAVAALWQAPGTFADARGNAEPRLSASSPSVPVNAAEPMLTLSVTPANALVEAGTTVRYNVSLSNSGNGTTGDIWLNLTLPVTFSYLSDSSGHAVNLTGFVASWHWTGLGPGTRTFALYLAAHATIPNGTISNLLFHLDERDAKGNVQPSLNAMVRVTFAAPTILLEVRLDHESQPPGGVVVSTILVQNAGLSPAHQVWLIDAVDPRLQVVSFTAGAQATGTQGLNWTLQDLAPGTSRTVLLTLRVTNGVPAETLIPQVVEATYTNGVGVIQGYTRSVPVMITVAPDFLSLGWILLGGAVLAATFVGVLYRWKRVTIEEVFLVYRDGVLLSHLSKNLLRGRDEDVLAGMLTAVQEFVRDAFQYGEHRELHQLDFGDYRILIERGRSVYLAVVYAGRESAGLRRKVRTVLDRIEAEYGPALEKWDGDMERVIGARDLIRDRLLGTANHARAARSRASHD